MPDYDPEDYDDAELDDLEHEHHALIMPEGLEPRTDVVAAVFAEVSKEIGKMPDCKVRPQMWPLSVKMACGYEYEWIGPDDFPLATLPCDCGDPEHIVVLWPATA